MSAVFVTPGGKAAEGILALRRGPLQTNALAQVMNVPPRRVHSYLQWALDAGAVVKLSVGARGTRTQTLWGIGDVPTQIGSDSGPFARRVLRQPVPRSDDGGDPLPVRRSIVSAASAPALHCQAASSVFAWRP